jgi:putative transposase
VTDAVHEEITVWQSRPLESVYAVVWLDALMVKIRCDGVVQNRAVYVAIGMTREGIKQVLGLWIESSEGAKFWMKVLSELRTRGVQDILIACCDGLKGFPAAIEAVFPKSTVQTCVVHQVRHSLSFVAWQDRKKVVAALKCIYNAESERAGREQLEEFEGEWGDRYPMIVRSWKTNWEQLSVFFNFPPEIRRIVYTTNAIESLNYQLRKVIKTKGHFPNEDATLKLLYLGLRNIERNWKAAPAFWKQAALQLIAFFGEERWSQ